MAPGAALAALTWRSSEAVVLIPFITRLWHASRRKGAFCIMTALNPHQNLSVSCGLVIIFPCHDATRSEDFLTEINVLMFYGWSRLMTMFSAKLKALLISSPRPVQNSAGSKMLPRKPFLSNTRRSSNHGASITPTALKKILFSLSFGLISPRLNGRKIKGFLACPLARIRLVLVVQPDTIEESMSLRVWIVIPTAIVCGPQRSLSKNISKRLESVWNDCRWYFFFSVFYNQT